MEKNQIVVFYEKTGMSVLNKPLSNLQIELLKLFSQGVSDEELLSIKRLIANFFADQASDEMDRLWETRNWSNATMDEWLKDDTSTTDKSEKE